MNAILQNQKVPKSLFWKNILYQKTEEDVVKICVIHFVETYSD